MDHSTRNMAEFATRLGYADLPPEVVHDCKRRIIDTIGCAIAAFDAEPVRMTVLRDPQGAVFAASKYQPSQ